MPFPPKDKLHHQQASAIWRNTKAFGQRRVCGKYINPWASLFKSQFSRLEKHGFSSPSTKSTDFGAQQGAGMPDALNQWVCWELDSAYSSHPGFWDTAGDQNGVGRAPLGTGLALPTAPLSLHSVAHSWSSTVLLSPGGCWISSTIRSSPSSEEYWRAR